VAGLCRPEQANWYGVDNADLLAGAGKLGVSRAEVERLLESLGLGPGVDDARQRSAATVASDRCRGRRTPARSPPVTGTGRAA
jgi:hypothetical protein